jgi:hypothetical protein
MTNLIGQSDIGEKHLTKKSKSSDNNFYGFAIY